MFVQCSCELWLLCNIDEPLFPHYAAVMCPHGHFLNVTGPRIYTAGEYPGSFKYGAWGRDPKPEEGKESWYWYVPMTSSNRYANYVRLYSSLSSLVVGVSVPGNYILHLYTCIFAHAPRNHVTVLKDSITQNVHYVSSNKIQIEL